MATQTLNRQRFLEARKCPRLAWLRQHQPQDQSPTPPEVRRQSEADEVKRRARALFTGGILVEEDDPQAAIQRTQELMADPGNEILFDAAFSWKHWIARVDVAVRQAAGWRILDIRTDAVYPDRLNQPTQDLSFSAMVVQGSGVEIEAAGLIFLDADYKHGKSGAELFQLVNRSDEVQIILPELIREAEIAAIVATTSDAPDAKLLPECASCPYFKTACLGVAAGRSVMQVPKLRGPKLEQLHALGAVKVTDIPDDFELSGMQRRFVDCVRSGQRWIGNDLTDRVERVGWPVYFLDFQMMTPALPIYPTFPPHGTVVTQYVLRYQEGPDNEQVLKSYAADLSQDCERKLVGHLLEDIEAPGTIIVFSDRERKQLARMATRFRRIKKFIDAIIGRTFDLEELFKYSYVDPRFEGQTSMEAVLPVLVPDFGYDDLAFHSHDEASHAFTRLTHGELADHESPALHEGLLHYGERRTLALERLYHALHHIAGGVAATPA